MVEVLPSVEPGMEIYVQKKVHGYTLNLGMMRFNPPILLMTASNDCETFDLIPSSVFEAKLPHQFVHDHVHWLERRASLWIMRKGSSRFLLSPTKLELPRLKLGFFIDINSNHLQSRQFRGMYVDTAQNIGTLIGLQSKLVLKNAQGNRKVLLPSGRVQFTGGVAKHPTIIIEHGTSDKVYPYDIDDLLGRTEESLFILNSAAVRSFQILSQDNLNRLTMIAQISPQRQYYPRCERLMETTKWQSNICALSQHGKFYKTVKDIVDQAERCKLFHPDIKTTNPRLDFMDVRLHTRHLIRSSSFQLAGFGAEDHTSVEDIKYTSRDELTSVKAVERVFKL
ncbi:hypothetical protein CDD81_1081 [Ophiocordyceps australis]|uniref:Uncharacterized protein n=1 Tax=Ophiocordyceps australis TaxID=1399860 RepID=A0A2C5XZN8_9HYPO|nr:hypothetical protein CDD81_1081 [Ophiocordyceps australis]